MRHQFSVARMGPETSWKSSVSNKFFWYLLWVAVEHDGEETSRKCVRGNSLDEDFSFEECSLEELPHE